MNLRTQTRSYEQITADAEKYMRAVIETIDDKKPTLDCESISLGTDKNCAEIFIDDTSKVKVNWDDQIRITLSETNESVVLNEEDAEEVKECFIAKVKTLKSYGLMEKILALPLVILDLEKAGKNPMHVTPCEIEKLIDAKIKSLQK